MERKASLVTQLVKTLSAMQETQVRFLGQEDPLEKEMAIHPSILAGKFHGQRSLAGVAWGPWGCKESDTTEQLTHSKYATEQIAQFQLGILPYNNYFPDEPVPTRLAQKTPSPSNRVPQPN